MKIGVVYPQTELGSDPGLVKAYAQAVEELGFSHLLAYDHVLGANPDRPGGWQGAYTHESSFLEPLVMFAYMAALTTRIELVTGILILPQRQTALVAKQAATLDVLCSGRLRLGVGLGWNQVEYAALGENFHNRGKRIEEQVDLLRRLWTEPLVVYQGKWHEVADAGIKPLPVQRPIPIWFGGTARAAILRLARIADGWLVNIRDPQEARPSLELLFAELDRLGRDRAKFGVEARIHHAAQGPEEWAKTLATWRSLGATHASFNTMKSGLDGADAHLNALRQFAAVIRDA